MKRFGVFLLCIFLFEFVPGRSERAISYGNCARNQFRCRNGQCISKSSFCDGYNNCRDNSDEEYCRATYNSQACPRHYEFFRCSGKCIPKVWKCDGVIDCDDRSDEVGCSVALQHRESANAIDSVTGAFSAGREALHWMEDQRQNAIGGDKWGVEVPRIAVALYLTDEKYFSLSNKTGDEISYELEIQLLKRLLRSTTKDNDPVSTNELAIYLHALIVSCIDPRDFHGIDLISELRQQVNEQENYTNPFVLLALCNAGDTMTRSDVKKLVQVIEEPQRHFWTDDQALTLMALSCIVEQSGLHVRYNLTSLASKLKKLQRSNGRIENLKTTALVTQALLASGRDDDDDDWDLGNAVKYMLKNQKSDGSFGNFLNTYYLLPLFQYKSLVNISSDHCTTANTTTDESSVIEKLRNDVGPKIHVTYSLWFGDKIDVVHTVQLRISVNSTLLDVMKLAAAIDSRYKFEYTDISSQPYIYALSGVQDDPENDKFWFLCKADNKTEGGNEMIHKSPSQVIPSNKEQYIMWYRTGHWNEPKFRALKVFVR